MIMKNAFLKISASIAVSLFATALYAEVKLPRIFSDNMILQRDCDVKIWGKADKGATVEVEFMGQKKAVTAGKDGNWIVILNPLKAEKAPQEIKIYENGKEAAKVKDVLVGEVWITGGQSNMAFGMGNVQDGKKIIEASNYHDIRYFFNSGSNTAKTPQEDVDAKCGWVYATPQTAANFSAVSYLFALNLRNALNVPVGVVTTAMSGTPMVSWVSQEVFDSSPNFAERKKKFDDIIAKYDYEKVIAEWEKECEEFDAKVAQAKAEGKNPPQRPYKLTELHKPWPDSPEAFRTPCRLFNAKVAPLTQFAARGFLWYQGENDASTGANNTFELQLAGLIETWRTLWGKADMPFIYIQLPSFTNKGWPDTRLKQTQVFNTVKHTGMVVTIDLGEEKDVHPKDKIPVGKRAANIALKDVYGFKDIVAYGPAFKAASFKGKFAKIEFDLGNSKFKDPQGEITGFEVLSNGKWVNAKATLKGNAVILESTDGGNVKGARYAYKDWAKPLVNLFNENELPAAPFLFEEK